MVVLGWPRGALNALGHFLPLCYLSILRFAAPEYSSDGEILQAISRRPQRLYLIFRRVNNGGGEGAASRIIKFIVKKKEFSCTSLLLSYRIAHSGGERNPVIHSPASGFGTNAGIEGAKVMATS